MQPVIRILALIILSQAASFAALTATVQWDVRTTGSDSNGGGFDAATAGTDRSQQNTAQVNIDNGAIKATCNGTTITFTTNTYTVLAGDVGNVVNMVTGTGLTPGRYLISSVGAGLNGTWVLDRTTGMSGGAITSGLMGGALLTIGTGATASVSGNTINIKAGTYTITSTLVPNSGRFSFVGFGTTHGDGGTKPLITTATDSTPIWTLSNNATPYVFDNLNMTSTATVKERGFAVTAAENGQITISRSALSGFSAGIQTNSSATYASAIQVLNTEIKNCTGAGISDTTATGAGIIVLVWGSYIHDVGTGITLGQTGTGSAFLTVSNSIISAASSFGIDGTTLAARNSVSLINSVIANSGTGIGIQSAGSAPSNAAALVLSNSIIYGNTTGVIVQNSTSFTSFQVTGQNNAFGGNGTDRTGFSALPGDVALSASPFVSSTNFALNSTAGGGAALKAPAGFPGVFPGGTTMGFLDIGAVQTQGAPASTGCASACVQ